MTVCEVAGFNGDTVQFFPHNDLARTPDDTTDLMEQGLEEGFHIIGARAFLKRDGKASLYNTFQQTFYYDAAPPAGEIVFPVDGQTVSGQSYDVVVRADDQTAEAWFYIDDGPGMNDDDATGAANGNGVGKWVQASEVAPDPAIASGFPKEFRFKYSNIAPGGVPAVIHVRLAELTSSDPSAWTGTVSPADAAAGSYTTLSRSVAADGLDIEMFIAFPSNDGDLVNDSYVLKAYFSKVLAAGLGEQELLDEFEASVASVQSGSPDGAVVQDPALLSIPFDETTDYHALLFDVPNLYNGRPDFLHTIRVTHERSGVALEASRQVRAAVQSLPFVTFVTPPKFNPDGQPYVAVLPDICPPDLVPSDRVIPVQVETDGDVVEVDVSVAIGGGGTTFTLDQEQAAGSQKYWDFTWGNVEPGFYRLRAEVRKAIGGPLVAVAIRDVTAEVGPAVPVTQDNDMDALPDWWKIANGLDPNDDGTTDPANGSDGDPDGDGLTNYEELLAGLNPRLADAWNFPQIAVLPNGDGTLNLSVPSIPDRLYRIYWAELPGSWSQFGSDIDTTGMAPGTILRTDAGPPVTPASPSVTPFRVYYLEIDLP